MDSRDISSQYSAPAAPVNSRGEPSTSSNGGEDDTVLSATAALVKDATMHFQSRRFSDCLDALNQLKLKKEDDPRVIFLTSFRLLSLLTVKLLSITCA
ncbi:hypothetical protein LINPERPRIM_LOCUS4667 [Linum perenne]